MKGLRGERLSAEYQRAVSEIIATKLKDKVGGIAGLVSITKADVSPDLKNAKLYVNFDFSANYKITYPQDIAYCEAMMNANE